MFSTKQKTILLITVLLLIFSVASPIIALETTGPQKVQNMDVERMDGEARVNWEPVNKADYYIIYKDNEMVTTTKETFYADNNVQKNRDYTYKVSAVMEGEIGKSTTKKLSAVQEDGGTGENLELVNEFSYFDGSNNPVLVGEIRNNGDDVVEDIELDMRFYLGEDLIGSKETHYQYQEDFGFTKLKSDEKAPFRGNIELQHNELISKIAGNLDKELRFEVEILNYSTTTEDPYEEYEINEETELNKEEGKFTSAVEIENTGTEEVEETTVCVTFYNESLGILGFKKKTLVQAPDPGEQKTVNLEFSEKYNKIEGSSPLNESASFTELIDSYEIQVIGTQ